MASAPPAGSHHSHSAGIVVLATIAVGCCALPRPRLLRPARTLDSVHRDCCVPWCAGSRRLDLPPPVGATIVVLAFRWALVGGGLALADPVRGWVAQAPSTLAAAHGGWRHCGDRSEPTISAAAKQVEGAAAPRRARPTAAVRPSGVGPSRRGCSGPRQAWSHGLVEVVLLTFLLLASGDAFLEKLVKVLPSGSGRSGRPSRSPSEAERAVSRYMVATALINAGQGAAGGAGHVAPAPAESAPLGHPHLRAGVRPVPGRRDHDHAAQRWPGWPRSTAWGRPLLPPAVYLTITTLQNNLVSPVAYGRGLRLNPVAVLVGVLFWWLLWGVPGAFLAVPILATLKILGEHVASLAPVAEFLGD